MEAAPVCMTPSPPGRAASQHSFKERSSQMKKITIGLSLLALGLAGTAFANHHGAGTDPLGDKDLTKAEFVTKHGEMFTKMDANKDGKLDQADRAAHHGQMFDKLDTDKNGSISRSEFDAAHQNRRGGEGMKREHGGRGGKMAKMMLHMADANKDGAVSRDEFMAGATRHFDMMDANKDGKLTKAERQAAHQKMRGKMGGKRGGQAGHGDHAGHDMPPPPPAN